MIEYGDSYFYDMIGVMTFIQPHSCKRPFVGNHNADVALSEFDSPALNP